MSDELSRYNRIVPSDWSHTMCICTCILLVTHTVNARQIEIAMTESMVITYALGETSKFQSTDCSQNAEASKMDPWLSVCNVSCSMPLNMEAASNISWCVSLYWSLVGTGRDTSEATIHPFAIIRPTALWALVSIMA